MQKTIGTLEIFVSDRVSGVVKIVRFSSLRGWDRRHRTRFENKIQSVENTPWVLVVYHISG